MQQKKMYGFARAGTGDWGPVKHDDGIVVVHGRKLLRHAVTSTGSLKT